MMILYEDAVGRGSELLWGLDTDLAPRGQGGNTEELESTMRRPY